MADFTTIPSAGQRVRGSVVTALFTELRPRRVRKTNDQALTVSSTTFQDITDLTLSVAASTAYEGELLVGHKLSTGVAEDIKVTMTYPSGAVVDIYSVNPDPTVGGALQMLYFAAAASGTTIVTAGLSTVPTWSLVRFSITTTGAGTLLAQAAQLNSGVNTVTVIAGSRLSLRQVA